MIRFKNQQINNRCYDAAIQMKLGDDDNQAISSTQQQLSSSPLSSTSININIKLDNVKNMRDISTVRISSYIKPNKVIRTGCVSRASDNDVSTIFPFHTDNDVCIVLY
jgi:hypothetical protein